MAKWSRYKNIQERFWTKVLLTANPDKCWIWSAGKTGTGYGAFAVSPRKLVQAHRFAYEDRVGPVSKGLVVDHQCHMPACVNPSHLRAVTQKENVHNTTPEKYNAGRKAGTARLMSKTHCKNDHQYLPDNLRFNVNGARRCMQCSRDAAMRCYYAKKI